MNRSNLLLLLGLMLSTPACSPPPADDTGETAQALAPGVTFTASADPIDTNKITLRWVVTGGFRTRPLPVPFPAQVGPDVAGNALWITNIFSNTVLRYDIASDSFKTLPLPKAHIPSLVGAAPWEVQVRGNFVYLLEFNDGDLVRIDRTAAATTNRCNALDAAGNNPCMVELAIPRISRDVTALWLDIEPSTNRLWFATSNVTQDLVAPNASGVGFIDIGNDMFRPGVLYTGMGSLVEPDRARVAPASFGGVSVRNGVVLVGDFLRRQLVRLFPRDRQR